MVGEIQRVLEPDPRVAYALLFGSSARGSAHATSDADVAIGLAKGTSLSPLELGELVARLETAVGRAVDLVLLDEAPPAVAYRIFREGHLLLERDPSAFRARKARAILEYVDFRPVEELCARGVLAAATRG